jgi:hypothetical protein
VVEEEGMNEMMDPYDPSGGMYVNLRRRMVQNLKAQGLEGSILELTQTAYEQTLKTENIMLTPLEKKKLFSDILKLLFEDMTNGFDGK